MLNYEYPPLGGGGSPVTKSLAEELVRQGHGVDVVTMGWTETEGRNQWSKYIQSSGYPKRTGRVPNTRDVFILLLRISIFAEVAKGD